ncbi:MAG: hypothetical protein WAK17_20640 [Candidatus Nitrosopolaris sp.]|jgi:hypothetical protein
MPYIPGGSNITNPYPTDTGGGTIGGSDQTPSDDNSNQSVLPQDNNDDQTQLPSETSSQEQPNTPSIIPTPTTIYYHSIPTATAGAQAWNMNSTNPADDLCSNNPEVSGYLPKFKKSSDGDGWNISGQNEIRWAIT